MADQDFEGGLFCAIDDIKMSAPWRVGRHCFDGLLTELEIKRLCDRFDLEEEHVRWLSGGLGYSLNTIGPISLRGVDEVAANRKASKAREKAVTDVNAAVSRLKKARERDADIRYLHCDDVHRDRIDEVRSLLDASINCVEELSKALSLLASDPPPAYPTQPFDRREIRDSRRDGVMFFVFIAWQRAGRPLTFTTDPLNNERRGPLLEFANEVVTCVTDPQTKLSNEAIVKDLLRFKAQLPSTSAGVDSREIDQGT